MTLCKARQTVQINSRRFLANIRFPGVCGVLGVFWPRQVTERKTLLHVVACWWCFVGRSLIDIILKIFLMMKVQLDKDLAVALA